MAEDTIPWLATVRAATAALPQAPAQRWAETIRHGSMHVGLYAPRGLDDQKPHRQDEIYVVVSGSGSFVRGDDRVPFGPGDVIFVPAGMIHRFEDFTDDFACWVVFYGPDGGEG